MADVLRAVTSHHSRAHSLRVGFLVGVLGACVLSCALASASAGAHAAPRRTGAIANPLGQDMFGIATNGAMQNEGPRTLIRDLNSDAATGAKWLRVDINWAQIQAGGPSSYDWTPIDTLVQAAEARGMQVLGVLVYTPAWAAARRSCRLGDCAPNTAAFARFAQVAVAHYAALGVNAYEVWSEENSTAQWLPRPSPAAYTRLLKASYPVMKAEDPGATIITGGTSPSPSNGLDWSPVDFLTQMYKDGAKPYFDAVGAHVYCWPAYPGQVYWWSSWYQTYGAADSMRSAMNANGDADKRIWGTEFGAPTYGPSGSYVSLKAQANMIYDGYRLWSTYRWAGPLFVFEGRDELPMRRNSGSVFNYLGLQFSNFAKKPSYFAYQRAVAVY